MKRIVWFFACTAVFALAGAGCDKGGVAYRDLGTGPVDVSEPADAVEVAGDAIEEVAPEVVATDVPAKADAPADTVVMLPNIPSNSFRFEMSGRDGEAFLVDVIGRDVGTVYGIALRVEFDPAAVEYVSTTPAPVFGADGEAAVYKSALVRPGSLTIGSMLKDYTQEVALTGDVKVATLKLKPLTKTASELRFFAERCLVVTRKLDKVETRYLGSMVYP
jgi:hypothetical protein